MVAAVKWKNAQTAIQLGAVKAMCDLASERFQVRSRSAASRSSSVRELMPSLGNMR